MVIAINNNEIPVSPGDFWRMNEAGMFTDTKIDDNDFVKIYGYTSDGKTYVSERSTNHFTEEQMNEYLIRYDIVHDISQEDIDEMFSYDIPPISLDENSIYRHTASYYPGDLKK